MTLDTIIFAVTGAALSVCGFLIVAICGDIRDQIKTLHEKADDHNTRLTVLETRCSLECEK